MTAVEKAEQPRLRPESTALLIYDVTESLVNTGPSFELSVSEGLPAIVRLLDISRNAGLMIIYALSAKGYAGAAEVPAAIAPRAGEIVIRHPQSGAFTDTGLETVLRDNGREVLLIAGMAVDRGCNTTARECLGRGIQPIVIRGACFTRDIMSSPVGPVSRAQIERVHLAALHRLGAWILTVEEVFAAING